MIAPFTQHSWAMISNSQQPSSTMSFSQPVVKSMSNSQVCSSTPSPVEPVFEGEQAPGAAVHVGVMSLILVRVVVKVLD